MPAKLTRTNNGRSTSELLFEEYLQSQGLEFEYEPFIDGKCKKPDFRVCLNGDAVFCEVKELDESPKRPMPKGAAMFDPYRGIRKEIHEVRSKFKEFKAYPCVLVLYNVNDWEFRDRPYLLFGAMLGNASLSLPFDSRRGRAVIECAQDAFLDGGKMFDPKRLKPQNTTISAIGVLSEFTIPNPDFERAYLQRIKRLPTNLGPDEKIERRLEVRLQLYDQVPVSLGRNPRICVFENPVARQKLPDDIFHGSYDTRHRLNQRLGRIERVFAGEGLQLAEQHQKKEGDILQKIERFKQAVVMYFSPTRVILFGSHANGRAEPDSDVDLLIEFQGDGDLSHRSLEIRKRVNPGFALDLLTRSAGEIERRVKLGDVFLREVVENGKTLYECDHARVAAQG